MTTRQIGFKSMNFIRRLQRGNFIFKIQIQGTVLLQTVLVCKTQEIYGSLSVEKSFNYKHVKEAIVKAYELVPEAYRQRFSYYLKYDSKTHVEFAREKGNLFNRWLHSKKVHQDFEKL